MKNEILTNKAKKREGKTTIKAVIWDNDGVLSNNIGREFGKLWAERMEAPLEDVIRVLTSRECKQFNMGNISTDEFRDFVMWELGLPDEKKESVISNSLNDYYYDRELHNYIRIQQRSYTTALLSVMPLHLQEMMRSGWPEFEKVFDHIIISCEVHLLKPDPRIYQLTLDRIGCRAGEAVFIDDHEENIEAAEMMGIRSILFKKREQAIEDLEAILSANL